MSSILVINAAGRETRVALVENGHIAEFYLERKKDKGVVGNIYKGRVTRVLPGMQAAFVEIGLDKAAFLYVTDVVYDADFARAQFDLTEGEHDEDTPEVPDEAGEGHGAEAPQTQGASDSSAHESHASAPGSHEPDESHDEASEEGDESASGQTAAEDARDDALQAAAADVDVTAPETPALDAAGQPVGAPTQARHDSGEMELEVQELPPGQLAPPSLSVRRISNVEQPALTPELIAGGTSPDASVDVGAAILAAHASEDSRPAGVVAKEAGPQTPPQKGQQSGRPPERGERQRPRDQSERKHKGKGNDRRREEQPPPRKQVKIEDVLKVGQEVVVQISKDPIGTKGARLTSHISIPGRHLVFMPTVDHVGISRRIGNERERRRLREIVDRMRPPGTGFIVRTVAENVPQEKLEADIRFLIGIWNQVVRRNEKRGPGLMHPDLDLILRATRDLFAQDVEKLVIDDRDEYERVLGFVTSQDPALASRVVLHDAEEPVFDAYGIEQEIQRAVQRKVWLRSGGYLIIDQAEALTAIDVNSGRYVGKKSLEETITKINTEAAKEIVYQLRLRNIGGIIICDFIDMEKQQNREKVFKTLQEALGRDKAKTNVLRISELGLVEMTRKRVRESIGRVLHEDCTVCDGQGFVKTADTVTYQIFRDIRREAPNHKDPVLVISCNADVARLLGGEERQELRHLMDRYNKTIQVRSQPTYHREQYELYGRTGEGTDHRLAHAAPMRKGSEEAERGNRGSGAGTGGGGGSAGGGGEREERGGRRGGRNRDRSGRREEGRPEARGEGKPDPKGASSEGAPKVGASEPKNP